jgi:hypothetical protein
MALCLIPRKKSAEPIDEVDVIKLDHGSEDASVSRWRYNERRTGGSRVDQIRGSIA